MTHIKQILKKFEEEFANLLQLHISNDKDRYFDEKENVKSFLLSSHISYLENQIEWLRGEMRKHKVFECNGTRKYEDWCEDENCPSEDARKIKAHNSALQLVIDHLQEELKEINKLTDKE